MKATLHPDAVLDIEEAASFYEREGSAAIAERFVAEIKRVIDLLLSNPEIGTPRAGGRRFHPTRFFPYGLIYRPLQDGIHVLVVRRHRRRPSFGAHRSPPKGSA